MSYRIEAQEDNFALTFSNNSYTKTIKANTYNAGGLSGFSVRKADAECLSEFKGYGNNSSRVIYTNYFPIKKESVVVFYQKHAGQLNERYDVIDNIEDYDFDELTDFNGVKYIVDESRGIITTTGYVAPELKNQIL